MKIQKANRMNDINLSQSDKLSSDSNNERIKARVKS